MSEIGLPLSFDQLKTKPPMSARPRLTDDIQQALSTIAGYDGSQRKLIRVSDSGVLYVASPLLKDIINVTATSGAYNYQGPRETCSDVIVKAHPNNTGLIWVRKDEQAGDNAGYPLLAGQTWSFSLWTLHNLHIHIVTDTEKAIVAYSF